VLGRWVKQPETSHLQYILKRDVYMLLLHFISVVWRSQ
jgi:hypothetical protein